MSGKTVIGYALYNKGKSRRAQDPEKEFHQSQVRRQIEYVML